MATAKINQEWHIVLLQVVLKHEFYSDGRLQAYSDYAVAKAGNEDYYWGMGLTAETVATV
jgi:acetyl-CoA acyltransferase